MSKVTRSRTVLASLLLGVVLVVLCWRGSLFSYKLYRYGRLSEAVPIVLEKGEVHEVSEGWFALALTYRFTPNQVLGITHMTSYLQARYHNPHRADAVLKQIGTRERQVFFDPRSPLTSATLEKHFPYRDGIYLVLVLGIGIYFCLLFGYLRRLER